MRFYIFLIFVGVFGWVSVVGAQFSDELLSIDLAPNPSNGDCLSTDGTDNIWDTCATGGGGGGGGVGWATTSDNARLYQTEGKAVIISPNDISATTTTAELEVVGDITALFVTATSTTATSTFPWLETARFEVSSLLDLFGTVGNSLDDFCTAITGGSGLCDGDDASGAGGAGKVATATAETAGHVSYWTTSSAGTALLGSAATGTLTESIAGLELDATRALIGGSAALSLTSGYVIPLSASTTEWAKAYASSTATTFGDTTTIDGTYNQNTGAHSAIVVADSIGNDQLAFDTGQALTTNSAPTFTGLTIDGNIIMDGTRYIEWGPADYTLTHSAGLLTFSDNVDIDGTLNLGLSDGCVQSASGLLTSTGSACGSGGGGSISTSSALVAGQAVYATAPGTIASVATGTVSAGTGLSVTAARSVFGGSLAIAHDTGFSGVLTASSSEWNTFYTTPSDRITAGTGIDWSGNTLNGVYTAGDGLTLTGEDFDFDGGASPSGDLGGTWASPSVTDDSHAHTGSSLSGLDISADTNLTAGDGLTLTDDDLDCDTASGSLFGCLTSTDWNTFSSKLGSYDAWTHPSAGVSATTSELTFGDATSTIFSATWMQATTSTSTDAFTQNLLTKDATTTSLFASIASGTNMYGFGLYDCDADGQTVSYDASTGRFGCGDDDGGAGGTPGGSDGQVQYNNGSAFGGMAGTFWDDTNNWLGLGTSTPGTINTVIPRLGIGGGLLVGGDIIATGTIFSASDDGQSTAEIRATVGQAGLTLETGSTYYAMFAEVADAYINFGDADEDIILTTNGDSYLNTDPTNGFEIGGVGTIPAHTKFLVNGRTMLNGPLEVTGTTSLQAATTTSLFSTIASSTNLFSSIGRFFDEFQLPFGTGKTVNETGECTWDTTDDQMVCGDSAGTARVVAHDEFKLKDMTIASTSVAFVSGGSLPVGSNKDAVELTQYRCYVSGGTSVVLNLTDGTNDTETITCNTTVSSDTDVATNDTFTADEIMSLEFGTVTGAVNYVHFEAYGRITRE